MTVLFQRYNSQTKQNDDVTRDQLTEMVTEAYNNAKEEGFSLEADEETASDMIAYDAAIGSIIVDDTDYINLCNEIILILEKLKGE